MDMSAMDHYKVYNIQDGRQEITCISFFVDIKQNTFESFSTLLRSKCNYIRTIAVFIHMKYPITRALLDTILCFVNEFITFEARTLCSQAVVSIIYTNNTVKSLNNIPEGVFERRVDDI